MTKTSKQTTSPYWRERELAEIAQKQARGATLAGEMERLYAYHVKAVETEIEGFLQRYADKEKLDLAEAKKRVAEFDVMAFEEKAKRYVAEKNFSSTANRELRLYNLKMKVSRAELLQYQLDLEMVALAEGERQLTEKFLNQAYVEELKRQAGLLGHGVPSPERIGQLAQASINANFYGAKWSERIWERQSELRKILQEDIEGMLFKGQNPVRLIPRLRKEFDVSRYEAKRLAVTEMARVSTEAQRQAFVEYGYERYEFIAEPSACERCSALDGEIFAVKDMRIGENASPMHPNCHCSVGAVANSIESEYSSMIDITESWIDGQKYQSNLAILNEFTKDGHTYVVDGHHVVLDHSQQEYQVANWLSVKTGRKVALVPRVNYPEGIHTPDYLVDGVPFDLKEIKGSGKSVIDNNAKKAKKQAPNIIFDITKTPLSHDEIVGQIGSVYNSGRRGVEIIIVKDGDDLLYVFKSTRQ